MFNFNMYNIQYVSSQRTFIREEFQSGNSFLANYATIGVCVHLWLLRTHTSKSSAALADS